MSSRIANVRTLVRRLTAHGESSHAPDPAYITKAITLGQQRYGFAVGRDGRCYIPYQRFASMKNRSKPRP